MMSKNYITRQQIYWVDLGKTIGSEIYKIRPCLVISSNEQNETSSRVIIVPITSQPVLNPLHAKMILAGKEAYLLPEQIRSISKKRIKWLMGEVSSEVMKKVSKLLHIICQLEENY